MTEETKYPADCIKVLDKGFVRLVDHMGDDAAIVQMARTSYRAGTKKISDDKSLIRYLIRNKHTGPLEGTTFKFHVKAPLLVFRQWHRHRTWSYNETSARYSVLPNECYVPKEEHFTKQDPSNKQGGTNEPITFKDIKNLNEWITTDLLLEEDLQAISDSHSWAEDFKKEQDMVREHYDRLIGTGVRRELARINLPLAQYSEMYAVVNLHNLFHFIKLRADHRAQFEMREYANAILNLIKPVVPIACEAFEDYILNSMTLSNTDIQALNSYLCGMIDNSEKEQQYVDLVANRYFPNKRERAEFINKIKKLTEK